MAVLSNSHQGLIVGTADLSLLLRLLVGGGTLYLVAKVLYRRFLHPLASVPGPFLPAVTRLYAWYYNVPGDGQFYKEVERLHSVYGEYMALKKSAKLEWHPNSQGPIVRITPDEVHLSDPKHYDTIYGVKSDFYKDPRFYGAIGIDSSTFATVPNDLHRLRRAALNPFFSRRKVLELESLGVVHEKVDKLCRIVSDDRAAGKPTNLHAAFRAISVDVITDYAFDDSWDQLDSEDLGQWFSDMVHGSGPMFWTFQVFPALRDPMQSLPEWVAKRMSPTIGNFLACQARTTKLVQHVQARIDQGIQPERTTIFHQLLDPDAAGGHVVPNTSDLVDEAFLVCTAAADTTGNAMTVAAFHVVTNPAIYDALTQELREAFPEPDARLCYSELEKLPYLTGVIKEGQRLSYGVIGRLPRVVPKGGVELEGYYLPEGTVTSMSSWMMHHDPVAFPSPETFDPTRWTDPSTFHDRDRQVRPLGQMSRPWLLLPLPPPTPNKNYANNDHEATTY
ncbi:hypothetical protein ACJZ2D_004021 [Fusarium nematophilum]